MDDRLSPGLLHLGEAMPEVKARSLSAYAYKRLDAAGAFAFGATLVALEAYFEEDVFEKFATEAFGYGPKHIRSHQRLASELGPWRSRAIRVGFLGTHLIRMLARTPEERDAILAKAEAGETVTAADVSNWNKPKDERDDPMAVGGLKGLRAMAQAKTKAGSAAFGANVGMIIAAIDEALAAGKSVIKNRLVEEIQKPARQASGELLNLVLFVAPEPSGEVKPLDFPEDSDWGEVHRVLARIGNVEKWPKKPELRGWLCDTVLPALKWAVSGTGPMKAPVVEADGSASEEVTAETGLADALAKAEAAAPKPTRKPKRSPAGADVAKPDGEGAAPEAAGS